MSASGRGLKHSALLAAVLCGATPVDAIAQACADGVVSEITYERHKPFGEDATSGGAGWLFRGMNSAHVRTVPQVIAWELLFEEGDCFNPALLGESARSLRSLPYIVEADLTSERLEDGSYRVDVRTIDAWALSLAVSFTVDQGFLADPVVVITEDEKKHRSAVTEFFPQ